MSTLENRVVLLICRFTAFPVNSEQGETPKDWPKGGKQIDA